MVRGLCSGRGPQLRKCRPQHGAGLLLLFREARGGQWRTQSLLRPDLPSSRQVMETPWGRRLPADTRSRTLSATGRLSRTC